MIRDSFEEHGVSMDLSGISNILSKKQMKRCFQVNTSRAIALFSLSHLAKSSEHPVTALDALGNFGLVAMQWTHHLGHCVTTTSNIHASVKNCGNPSISSISKKCNIVAEDCHVLMHTNHYSFIYIEAPGSAVMYLNAAFRSINRGGVMVVTSCDMPVLMNRCPDTTTRVYGAKLSKTEYIVEMGARVLIANMVRAASSWNKAIMVECCNATEHCITVVCRVYQSCKSAEKCAGLLRLLAHCQSCQSRKWLSNGRYASMFSCSGVCGCNSDNLSAMMILGPIWAGPIFNHEFVKCIYHEAAIFNLSSQTKKILQTMACESACFDSDEKELKMLESVPLNDVKLLPHDSHGCKQIKLSENHLHTEELFDESLTLDTTSFYFDVQCHMSKGSDPPKWNHVIQRLRQNNFRASKSHFGDRCVRTNASLAQFEQIIRDIRK